MQRRSGVLVLAMVLLLGLASGGYGKNARLLDKVHKRIANIAHGTKRLLIKGDGEHALLQKLVAGAGLAILVCTSVSCGGSAALRGVEHQQQYVRSAEEIMGRHVHFVSEGHDYMGYVTDAPASDEVSIDLYDGHIMTVKTSQVRGIRLDTHQDERLQVILNSTEEGQKFRHAFVVAVYDDNFYELVVGAYMDHNGNMVMMEFPYVIITHFDDIVSVFGEPFD